MEIINPADTMAVVTAAIRCFTTLPAGRDVCTCLTRSFFHYRPTG
jgi:hypothetical protein